MCKILLLLLLDIRCFYNENQNMKNISEMAGCIPLFKEIQKADIGSMLKCIKADVRTYAKGEYIYRSGNEVSHVGQVLYGSVHIVREDYWGNRSIIMEVPSGGIFGEAFACSLQIPFALNAVAAADTSVLFLDVQHMVRTCSRQCAFHLQLIRNLIAALSQKAISQTEKIGHLTHRTTRGKLLSFLSSQRKLHNSDTFEIPFNRQEMADYLAVDRSAMSNMLCKLRDEGLIDFRKNRFTIKPPGAKLVKIVGGK